MLIDRLVLINMILCLFVAWSCTCRLKLTSKIVKLSVRNRYVIIGTGSLLGAFGRWVFPFWGGDGVGLVLFVAAIAIGFWLDKKDWERGAPPSSIKGDLNGKDS